MGQLYDCIIAGAGPIGLSLACELGLARASVLVLERDLNPQSDWKADPLGLRGLNTVAVEALYRRGLLNKVTDSKKRPSSFQKTSGFQFGGHFAGIMLNSNELALDRWKYRLNGPSFLPGPTTIDQIERVLSERAESLGVTILRGSGVTDIISQDEASVTVQAGESQSFRGRWLVGCDGGRSVVRKAAGFDFVGTEAQFTGYAVKCDWEPVERLKQGFHHTKHGMYIIRTPNTLYMTDFDGGSFDRNLQITKEHIQSVFDRITGLDVAITKIHLASTFTDRCKQATAYRKSRILLAGDAAHIHGPIGSQGLNLGLGDAINLGWKLGATIRRESESDGTPPDLSLLDTYESERLPAGTKVLDYTRAQVAIMRPGLYGAALQALIRDIIATTDGMNLFIDRQWGLSQRYTLGEDAVHAHPLVGSSAPDFEFSDGSRLGSRLENGRGLLVDLADDISLKESIADGKYKDRVDYLNANAKDTCGLRAVLVRPDGIVAWIAEDGMLPNVEALDASLKRWFAF